MKIAATYTVVTCIESKSFHSMSAVTNYIVSAFDSGIVTQANVFKDGVYLTTAMRGDCKSKIYKLISSKNQKFEMFKRFGIA